MSNLKPFGTCRDCGTSLTQEERYYYEDRCGDCEGKWSLHIDAWRNGEVEDELLDAIYSKPEKTKH